MSLLSERAGFLSGVNQGIITSSENHQSITGYLIEKKWNSDLTEQKAASKLFGISRKENNGPNI